MKNKNKNVSCTVPFDWRRGWNEDGGKENYFGLFIRVKKFKNKYFKNFLRKYNIPINSNEL